MIKISWESPFSNWWSCRSSRWDQLHRVLQEQGSLPHQALCQSYSRQSFLPQVEKKTKLSAPSRAKAKLSAQSRAKTKLSAPSRAMTKLSAPSSAKEKLSPPKTKLSQHSCENNASCACYTQNRFWQFILDMWYLRASSGANFQHFCSLFSMHK